MFVGGPHTTDNVEYRVGLAEALEGIEDESVDLLTTAQAAHWFQLEPFYRELNRVLQPSTPSTLMSLSSSSSTTLIRYHH
jgi:ubiquinone/menaquinone biosynthesis C-methylase UbiE